ncbi:MAG TPA: 50S ribosomal protein L11 methyltransferase [Chthoniobacterales bacterium]
MIRLVHLWKFHATAAWLQSHGGELEELPPANVAIISRPGRTRSIVEVTCATRSAAVELTRRFGGSFEQLPRNWQTYYLARQEHAPIRVARRLLIVTEPIANKTAQLVIPAAGAFGTGEHATTAMCLRLLEEVTRSWPRGWRMLDLGTGSGILALAARCFGAREITGYDNDPQAVAHARANAQLNEIRDIKFVRQDLARWQPGRRFDFLTANLFSELLIAAAPKLRRALRAHGQLLVSGILREQAGSVARALRRADFTIERQRRRGKWIALLAAPKT